MEVKTKPAPVVRTGLGGYIGSVSQFMSMAYAGNAVTVSVPGRDPVRITYEGGGKYRVGGRSYTRAKASTAVKAALEDSVGATYEVSSGDLDAPDPLPPRARRGGSRGLATVGATGGVALGAAVVALGAALLSPRARAWLRGLFFGWWPTSVAPPTRLRLTAAKKSTSLRLTVGHAWPTV